MLAAPSLAEILDCWIGGIMNTITPCRRHTTGTGIGYASIGPKCLRLILRTGGEGGIRTLGTGVSPYNGLANRRIRPLCHLSGVRNLSLSRSALRSCPPARTLIAAQHHDCYSPSRRLSGCRLRSATSLSSRLEVDRASPRISPSVSPALREAGRSSYPRG